MARVKALSTMLNLKDESDIETYVKLQKELEQSLYFAEFEIIKAGSVAQNYEKCDKLALVRSLLLSNGSNIFGYELICKIALDNELIDGDIWVQILQSLYQSKRYEFLTDLFSISHGFSEFMSLESVKELYPKVAIKRLAELIDQQNFRIDELVDTMSIMKEMDKSEFLLKDLKDTELYTAVKNEIPAANAFKLIAIFNIVEKLQFLHDKDILQSLATAVNRNGPEILEAIEQNCAIPAIVEIKQGINFNIMSGNP